MRMNKMLVARSIMLNLSSAVLLTIINMAYAAVIYLSLHGWPFNMSQAACNCLCTFS